MRPHFSREFLRAVNDWQAGSIRKGAKAAKLRRVVERDNVEDYLRTCDVDCYRRSVVVGSSASELFFEFSVSEETSAWTTQASFAFQFRGGPPDPGNPPLQAGVIFRHRPQVGEVVVNLERLHSHEAFEPCVTYWESEGTNFQSGIRRYGNSQAEVIMSVDRVRHDEIYSFGSNAAEAWKAQGVGGLPVLGETALTSGEIERSAAAVGASPKRWLTDEGTRNAYLNFIHTALGRLEARYSF